MIINVWIIQQPISGAFRVIPRENRALLGTSMFYQNVNGQPGPFKLFRAALLKALKNYYFTEKSTKCIKKVYTLALDMTFGPRTDLDCLGCHDWASRKIRTR